MADKYAIQILNVIRSRQGCRLKHIQNALPDEFRKAEYGPDHPLVKTLKELMKWKLIEILDQTNRKITLGKLANSLTTKCKFSFTPQALDIEDALEISFGGRHHTLFGPPVYLQQYPPIFVLMPFASKLRPIYDKQIKEVASACNLECKRADEFPAPHIIVSEIWSAISQARIIIADCTGKNPNVFYEIGIAHALGKDTILIAQSDRDIPFDLKPIRFIIYKTQTEDTLKDFRDKLDSAIKSITKIWADMEQKGGS